MSDPEGTVLRGLPGDNPLGFLAALGVQVAMEDRGLDCRLHWTDDPIPRPVVTPARDLEEITNAALAVAAAWLDGPALHEAIEPKLKLRRPQHSGVPPSRSRGWQPGSARLLPAGRGQSGQRRKCQTLRPVLHCWSAEVRLDGAHDSGRSHRR